MKIALCSTFFPFDNYEEKSNIDLLEIKLKERGHQVENICLPQVNSHFLLKQIAAFRFIDLSTADRIICVSGAGHFIPHSYKIIWFDQFFPFYELPGYWDKTYLNDVTHQKFLEELRNLDILAIREAKKIFTNSIDIAEKLKTCNFNSEILHFSTQKSQMKKNIEKQNASWDMILDKLLS